MSKLSDHKLHYEYLESELSMEWFVNVGKFIQSLKQQIKRIQNVRTR